MERVGDKAAVTKAYAAALERWPTSLGASIGLSNEMKMALAKICLDNEFGEGAASGQGGRNRAVIAPALRPGRLPDP